jgi:hypothetical protein
MHAQSREQEVTIGRPPGPSVATLIGLRLGKALAHAVYCMAVRGRSLRSNMFKRIRVSVCCKLVCCVFVCFREHA